MKTSKIFFIFFLASLFCSAMQAMERKNNDLEAQLIPNSVELTLAGIVQPNQSTPPAPQSQSMQERTPILSRIGKKCCYPPYNNGNCCCYRQNGSFDYENFCCKPICAVGLTAALEVCCWALNKKYSD